MNALEKLITRFECGFITSPALLAELIALDRLHPVLVRCGACRFTCAAQCVEHLEKCIDAGGDYVRDISLPVGSAERAAQWQPKPVVPHTTPEQRAEILALAKSNDEKRALRSAFHSAIRSSVLGYPVEFNEADCGGVFDGINTVTSDADSGL